jgi:hypothetical protein
MTKKIPFLILSKVCGLNYNVTITKNGEPLKCNVLKTVYPNTTELPKIGTCKEGKKWFTNFNQNLLDSYIDYKSQNC